ncbi:MAG TPA: hypothetical protein VJH23_01670 [archaeon]|nr:hypothetical protein [archaeon]
MDLEQIILHEYDLKRSVKKNCLLCMGRSHLHTNRSDRNPEKEQVQSALRDLYSAFNAKFDILRKKNYSEVAIMATGDNKRLILDTLEVCKGCDREVDRANRALNQLK